MKKEKNHLVRKCYTNRYILKKIGIVILFISLLFNTAFAQIPDYKRWQHMRTIDQERYIGVYLEEPHVWGTLLFRDQIVCVENDIEVFIDPNDTDTG